MSRLTKPASLFQEKGARRDYGWKLGPSVLLLDDPGTDPEPDPINVQQYCSAYAII